MYLPVRRRVHCCDGVGSPSSGDSRGDMSVYRDMDMFNRHNEIKRVVEKIPGGVRTITRSDSPDPKPINYTHMCRACTSTSTMARKCPV